MPQNVHAARCMVKPLPTTLASQYRGLWITDGLLAETFREFCHTRQRRYGSNVPGPLEARRRASKRKNTSLAYVGGGDNLAPYNPMVMLGEHSKQQWWKAVEANEENNAGHKESTSCENIATGASRLLPSWLFGPPPPPPPPPAPSLPVGQINEAIKYGESDNSLDVLDVKVEVERVAARFKASIIDTNDLDSAYHIIRSLQGNFRRHPDLSEFAFQHLIELCVQQGTYAQFAPALFDPDFHPPGSSNHLFFVERVCQGSVNQMPWETVLLPAILKAVQLGLVGANSLQSIIQLIPKVHKATATSRQAYPVRSAWLKILSAINESDVLRLGDIDSDFLSKWYHQIDAGARSDVTCRLLWNLRKFSGLSEMQFATKLVIEWLEGLKLSGTRQTQHIVEWLASFPVEFLQTLLVRITLELVDGARQSDQLGYEPLQKWSSVLPRLQKDAPERFSRDFLQLLSHRHLESTGLTSEQKCVSIIWMVIRLHTASDGHIRDVTDGQLRRTIDQLLVQTQGRTQPSRIDLMWETLETLPLPEMSDILEVLQDIRVEMVALTPELKDSASISPGYLDIEYARLLDNSAVAKLSVQNHRILATLSESINTDLTQFEAMARVLIFKSPENFRIVQRLLRHNKTLQFSLSQSWPSSSSRPQLSQNVKQPDLNPKAVLAMLERLAMTFAVAQVASPKSCLKQVHKIYQLLSAAGAPINPVIGRSLWHAGVTRYGETGAPKTQVQWCASKVREIEGEQAVENLLWSVEYRDAFIRDYVQALQDHTALCDTSSRRKRDVHNYGGPAYTHFPLVDTTRASKQKAGKNGKVDTTRLVSRPLRFSKKAEEP